MKFSVVIPAYNSHSTLPALVSMIKKRGIKGEQIIVIDDGSERPYEIEGVNLIRFEKNRGKGFALRTGYELSLNLNFKYSISVDADLQHPPDKLKDFIENLKEDTIVLGWRKDRRRMPLDRRFTNFLASFFTSLYLNRRVHDAQCGFRGIPLNILKNKKFWSDGYEFEVELLCKSRGFNIKEIEIPTIYGEGTSHINKINIVWRYMILVWRLLWHL